VPVPARPPPARRNAPRRILQPLGPETAVRPGVQTPGPARRDVGGFMPVGIIAPRTHLSCDEVLVRGELKDIPGASRLALCCESCTVGRSAYW
jgi:hypothetical protein